jgi:hypothetical protein
MVLGGFTKSPELLIKRGFLLEHSLVEIVLLELFQVTIRGGQLSH